MIICARYALLEYVQRAKYVRVLLTPNSTECAPGDHFTTSLLYGCISFCIRVPCISPPSQANPHQHQGSTGRGHSLSPPISGMSKSSLSLSLSSIITPPPRLPPSAPPPSVCLTSLWTAALCARLGGMSKDRASSPYPCASSAAIRNLRASNSSHW